MRLACLLTAAGNSSRFGNDKLLLPIGGLPMGIRSLRLLQETNFSLRVLVTSDDKNYLIESAYKYGFIVLINPCPERGLSSSVKMGVDYIRRAGEYNGILFSVADQPKLSTETISALIQSFTKHPEYIWAPEAGGKRGNPTIFPSSLFGELLQITGDRGGSQVIKKHTSLLRTISVKPEQLKDIDTMEDMQTC